MALDAEELNVAKIIGIDDGCIMKFMSGRKSTVSFWCPQYILRKYYLIFFLFFLKKTYLGLLWDPVIASEIRVQFKEKFFHIVKLEKVSDLTCVD